MKLWKNKLSFLFFQQVQQLWASDSKEVEMNATALKASPWGKLNVTFWGWRNTSLGWLPGFLKHAAGPLDTKRLNRATCLDRCSEKGEVCMQSTRGEGCWRVLFEGSLSDKRKFCHLDNRELLIGRLQEHFCSVVTLKIVKVQKWLTCNPVV